MDFETCAYCIVGHLHISETATPMRTAAVFLALAVNAFLTPRG